MTSGGEQFPAAESAYGNEVFQQQIVQDCIAQVIAGVPGMLQSNISPSHYVDDGLVSLARATDDARVAGLITNDERRLTSLAGIARRTADDSLRRHVVQSAINLLDGPNTSPFKAIAAELEDRTSLLDAMTDPARREELVYAFATYFEDIALVRALQDPARREDALMSIIVTTPRDTTPFLGLLNEEQQRRAINERAVHKKDVALAETIAGIADRTRALLNIAKLDTTRQKVPLERIAELLPQIPDSNPVAKAKCIQDYMGFAADGGRDQVPLLQATAQQIDDPVARAPFLALVFANTKDPALGSEVERVLTQERTIIAPYAADEIRAGLAIGRNDLSYARDIYDSTLHYKTTLAVLVATRDVEAARNFHDPILLHDFALARFDMALAADMARSDDSTTKSFGLQAVLEISYRVGDMKQVSHNIPPVELRLQQSMIVDFLVAKNDVEAAQQIADTEIRHLALTYITIRRRDLVLAGRLGLDDAVRRLEQILMAKDTTAAPFSDVERIEDPERRAHAYLLHSADMLSGARDVVLGCIRQSPIESQPYWLSEFAERVNDPLIAYEALDKARGAINTYGMIEVVARMVSLVRGRPLRA